MIRTKSSCDWSLCCLCYHPLRANLPHLRRSLHYLNRWTTSSSSNINVIIMLFASSLAGQWQNRSGIHTASAASLDMIWYDMIRFHIISFHHIIDTIHSNWFFGKHTDHWFWRSTPRNLLQGEYGLQPCDLL